MTKRKTPPTLAGPAAGEPSFWDAWKERDDAELEALFNRVREGSPSVQDNKDFTGAFMLRFVRAVRAGKPIDDWILNTLADRFQRVLEGEDWRYWFGLPWLPPDLPRDLRSMMRDAERYKAVENALAKLRVKRRGATFEEAAQQVASDEERKYSTIRDSYYRIAALFRNKS